MKHLCFSFEKKKEVFNRFSNLAVFLVLVLVFPSPPLFILAPTAKQNPVILPPTQPPTQLSTTSNTDSNADSETKVVEVVIKNYYQQNFLLFCFSKSLIQKSWCKRIGIIFWLIMPNFFLTMLQKVHVFAFQASSCPPPPFLKQRAYLFLKNLVSFLCFRGKNHWSGSGISWFIHFYGYGGYAFGL